MKSDVENSALIFRIEMTKEEYQHFCTAANNVFMRAVATGDSDALLDANAITNMKNSLSLALHS